MNSDKKKKTSEIDRKALALNMQSISMVVPFGFLACFLIYGIKTKNTKYIGLFIINLLLAIVSILLLSYFFLTDSVSGLIGIIVLASDWTWVYVHFGFVSNAEKNESTVNPMPASTPPLNEVEKMGTKLIGNLRKWKREIESVPLQEDIEQLIQFAGMVMKRNDAEAWKFFTIYSDKLDTMLGKYDEIENTRINSPEMLQAMTLIEKSISEIVVAFRNEVNDMYKKDILDLSADTKAFLYNLKRKGVIE